MPAKSVLWREEALWQLGIEQSCRPVIVWAGSGNRFAAKPQAS